VRYAKPWETRQHPLPDAEIDGVETKRQSSKIFAIELQQVERLQDCIRCRQATGGHNIKHDGYRFMVRGASPLMRLFTRRRPLSRGCGEAGGPPVHHRRTGSRISGGIDLMGRLGRYALD
jgi:hypothetical protein